MTDPREPLDVDALMEGIRARVAEKKSRGLYSVDALALDTTAGDEPWDRERLEELQAAAAVSQRGVVPPSDKPGVGAVVTAAKRVVVKGAWHNLEDLAAQITRFNAEISAYAGSLATEVARLRREVDALTAAAEGGATLDARVARLERAALDRRLSRLEAGAVPASPAPPTLAAEPAPAVADGLDDLRLDALLAGAPGADPVPHLAGRRRVIHLRCGDGALTARLGDGAVGVDARPGLAAEGARAGRPVVNADPVAHLEAAAPGEADAVLVTGLLEELPRTDLGRLVRALGRAVAPHGVVVAEVRNPRSLREMSERFWRDPRRLRPVDPEAAALLLEMAGFPDTELAWAPAEDGAPATGAPGAASPSCLVVARR